MRLDKVLVERGLSTSRTRAANWIRDGHVLVNARVVDDPAKKTNASDDIQIHGLDQQWVSRGAFKLLAALQTFKLCPRGLNCIDLGSSTGGFTEVLLHQGAQLVYSVDVGQGQLHESLQHNKQVISLEKTNARDLTSSLIEQPVQLVVSDLSFISLKLGLPASLELLEDKGHLIALIKPQFEVGKGKLGKNGVVKDPDLHQTVCENISRFLVDNGMTKCGLIESPVLGPKGNKEFLIHATKNA